jgi:hypothetical protein
MTTTHIHLATSAILTVVLGLCGCGPKTEGGSEGDGGATGDGMTGDDGTDGSGNEGDDDDSGDTGDDTSPGGTGSGTDDTGGTGSGTGGETGVDQEPMTFEIVNQSDDTVYVWLTEDRELWPADPRCQRLVGNEWEECIFGPIPCDCDCEGADFPDPATQIEPGGSYEVTWNGVLHQDDGFCYVEIPLEAGQHRVSVNAYLDFVCLEGETCTLDENGKIPYALPTGSPTTYSVDFSVPYLENVLTVTIE